MAELVQPRYPQVDFSALANLPDRFEKGQLFARQRALRGTNAFNPDGSVNYQAIWQNDPELAIRAMNSQNALNGVYGNIYWDGQGKAWALGKNGHLQAIPQDLQPSVKPLNLGDRERLVGPGGVPYNAGQAGGPDIAKSGPVPPGYTPFAGAGSPIAPGESVPQQGMPGTPEEMSQPAAGRGRLSGSIGVLGDTTTKLWQGGGISTPGGPKKQNVEAYIANTGLGQEAGRALGTQNQSYRDTINATIPLVLSDIKSAAGLSAQQLNSNVELQFYTRAATGGGDIISRLAAVDALDQAYGRGDALESTLPPDLFAQVRNRSKAMLMIHRPPAPDSVGARPVPTMSVSPDGNMTPTPPGKELADTIAKVKQARSLGRTPAQIEDALKTDGVDPRTIKSIMDAIAEGP